jgi:hypothetical protein
MDEKMPADNSGQATGKQTDVLSIVLPTSEQVQATDNCAQKKEECQNKKSYWKSFLNAGADRHIELMLGVLIASFACFQLIASCNNSRSSTAQMQNLQTAADRIDDAAESFSRSSADISRSMGDAVTKLQTQADKMDKARVSSERDSTQTLKATIESFHQEDRAWVGISEVKPLNYIPNPVNKSVSMTIAFTFKNYGHSAAEHVRFLANLESDPSIYSLSCDEVASKNHAGEVLLPTQTRTLNWVMNLTHAQMESGWTHQNPQLGHELFLRIVGCIEYTDRKREIPPHSTPFSYIVWTRGFITPDVAISGDQLFMDPIGTDTDQTH